MTVTDLLYGRQGGRVGTTSRGRVDPDTAPRCAICGGCMLLGQRTTHLACTEQQGYQHPQGVYPASTTLTKGSPHHAGR